MEADFLPAHLHLANKETDSEKSRNVCKVTWLVNSHLPDSKTCTLIHYMGTDSLIPLGALAVSEHLFTNGPDDSRIYHQLLHDHRLESKRN